MSSHAPPGDLVFAYRDETGPEAVAVIEMPGGGWAAFEVRLGLGEVDAAADHLVRLKGRIDAEMAGEPLALAVITATGYGYVRKDGVGGDSDRCTDRLTGLVQTE